MIPVVGAGFFWRTLAREASVFLPLAAGTVPKVTIAYTGTVAVGRAADYYYRSGKKPSRELMESFYRAGLESLRKREIPFGRRYDATEARYRVVDDRDDDFSKTGS
jgi:hypothetical protein